MGILTPQIVAESFNPQMLDASECLKWLTLSTRGDCPQCPSCGDILNAHNFERLLDGKTITCSACGVSSSPRSGTIFEGSTLDDRQIFFILALLHLGVPVDLIASLAGCTRATVYNWRNRLGAQH